MQLTVVESKAFFTTFSYLSLICKDSHISVDVSVAKVKDKVVYLAKLATYRKRLKSAFIWRLELDRMLHIFSSSQDANFFCLLLNMMC